MVTKQIIYYIELPMMYSYKDFDCLISENTLEQVVSDEIDGENILGSWDNWDLTFEKCSTYYPGSKIASIKIISSNYTEDLEETLEIVEREIKESLTEVAKFSYYLKLAEDNRLNLTEEEL